jgi:predicted nucleic acid-binding protein
MLAAVVDASAVAAVVFDEPEGATIVRRLNGIALCAPRLFELELANAACSKIRRARASTDELLANLADADRLGVTLLDPPVGDVLDLALSTGLTPYDASYLWLAMAFDVPLVTLDKELGRAAKRAGL